MPNETNIPATPMTRLEQYWAGILEKIEGGGGGNPNYVETITGTLANPWGTVDVEQLRADILSNNVSVIIEISLPDGGTGPKIPLFVYEDAEDAIYGSAAVYMQDGLDGVVRGFYLLYSGGVLWYCVFVQAGYVSDETVYQIVPLPDDGSTTLTIIHHPLPDTP